MTPGSRLEPEKKNSVRPRTFGFFRCFRDVLRSRDDCKADPCFGMMDEGMMPLRKRKKMHMHTMNDDER